MSAGQFKVGDRASQVARYMALTTCPHCGRDLDGEELATGLCASDDCPRHDEQPEVAGRSGPTPECKGLVFWPIPQFDDASIAFGAAEKHYFNRRDLPTVPRKFTDMADSLFFSGGKIEGLAPQVDKALANRAIRAWLSSWAPAHESKAATVGYALWLWSTPAALTEQAP